jgi:hypothetical protein
VVVGGCAVTFHTAELDGKRIAYSSGTEFLVQVGKGSKGKYATRYRIIGNFEQALRCYRLYDLGHATGYKKRLVSWDMNKPLLARQVSR